MTGLLLDTNALVFAVSEPDKLSGQAHVAILEAQALYLSTASLWELALKFRRGKLEHDARVYHRAALDLGVQLLAIEADDIHALDLLNDFEHSDPFDRLIMASAKRRLLPLVTGDVRIRRYLTTAIW